MRHRQRGEERGNEMSCEKFDRDEFEVRLAEHIRAGLPDERYVDVYVQHVRMDENHEDPKGLQLALGTIYSVGGGEFDPETGPEGATLVEFQPDDSGGLSVWKFPDGNLALVPHSSSGARPRLAVPLFVIRLVDWPIERGLDEDLGQKVQQAFRLLADACLGAREYAFELDRVNERGLYSRPAPGSGWKETTAEPGPQPEDHDHPCERGESP